MNLTDADVRRFWAKVALPDENGCMLWLAKTRTVHGYGLFWISGGRRLASRVSLTICAGPPDEPGLEAAHAPVICHRPACVAPWHLRWTTHIDNQADKIADGTVSAAERNGIAKFKWAQVRDIRARFAAGISQGSLAREYGVNQSTVSRLVRNETWIVQGEMQAEVDHHG